MRIAYCEDERAQAVLTEDMIKSWAKERGQKCIVDVFSSAEQFLFELDGEKNSYPMICFFLIFR